MFRGYISSIIANTATVTAAKAAVAKAAEAASKGETIRLEVGFDNKEGTDGNDTFKAPAYNNSNSFESGDELDGGAGSSDKLVATLGDSSSFAVRAETKSIEEVYFTSQAQNELGNDGNNDVKADINTVDAELMSGVREWWNDDSRADLTIEDVRSTSSTTTIGMRDTDAGTVDYSVYFDKQYITDAGSGAGDSTLEIRMVNAYTLKEDNNPIGGFETITFTVGNQPVIVKVSGLTTYAQVISAIEDELDAQGITNVTVKAQNDRTVQFSDDIGSYKQGQDAGSYTPILITSTGADLVKGTVEIGSDVEDYNGLNTMTKDETPDVPSLTQTNVVLDNVGRDSKSGVLEIGAMSQSNYSGSKGIQQFNIDVERSSWLEEIRSTNDSLEVLDIRNIAITKGAHTTKKSKNGDLRVDNLEDVRVIDAAKMTGALTLTDVQLTDAVVEKYLELKDDASNPSADNSQTTSYLDHDGGTFNKGFSYEFGSGNDTMNLTISNANLAAAGTTTREDFDLVIDGGAGNDTITTIIGDGTGINTDVWYINSKINANLTINGGEGNDTIWTKGAGDFKINAGTGNDTVYTDNIGIDTQAATWLVNTAAGSTNVNNLQSGDGDINLAPGVQTQAFLVNGKLTVTLSDSASAAAAAGTNGYEVVVDIPTTNYVVTALQLNQAIKTAINGDPVLSKLLVAKDGPAGTLVITSLIDGVFAANDLLMTVSSTAAAGTAIASSVVAAYDKFINNTGAATAIATIDAASSATVTELNKITGMTTNQVLGQDYAATALAVATTTPGTASIPEVTTITYAATSGATVETFTVTVDGVEYTTADLPAATTIANVVLAINAVSNGVFTAAVAGTNITITQSAPGNVAVSASTSTLTDLTGTTSTVATDNTIDLGAGNDVLVLSTSTLANETIVFKGYDLGNDTIVNFVAGAGAGADVLNFTEYLGGAEATAAGVAIATAAAGVLTDQTAYVLQFDDTVANVVAAKITFDTLTAAQVKAALNGSTAATDLDTLVFGINSNSTTTGDNILIIENKNNLGEYKIFDLNSTVADTNFDSVQLIGTVDFGATQAFTGDNLA
ncbi:beta strand repeat-containing protein [Aliarcobacter cryaerophilus]|uniref:beta strand repeat-containing protein n=1 Tax=Aliarcobacter cryaerophilus TaxID=28198 RepID=UPI0021B3F479|nr:hypothetical protein [Aliarcobacter cryaerophilus]MCT7508625.1 hypothetical protein [Aliarcobacter cryaerophilus]